MSKIQHDKELKPVKKSGKKSAFGRMVKGAALFAVYAAVYPKIAEHLGYLINDLSSKRR